MDSPIGASPLHSAVEGGSVLDVCTLLRHGADPNAVAGQGYTPLHRAAVFGRLEVCAILVDQGADPQMRVNGSTAFDCAVEAGQTTVAHFFDFLSDMNERRKRLNPGHSTLELAVLFRKREGKGEPCSQCGAPIPSQFNLDHLTSHIWQIQVQNGECGGRAPGQQEPLSPPEEPVLASFDLWNSGKLLLTDQALHMVTFEALALFPDQYASSMPWEEVQSTGFSTSGDPYAFTPWTKIHHVTVRGHHGLAGMDIACKSEKQADEIANTINRILMQRRARGR